MKGGFREGTGPPVNWNAFLLNRFVPVAPRVDPSFHLYSPSVALSFNPISTLVTTNNAIKQWVCWVVVKGCRILVYSNHIEGAKCRSVSPLFLSTNEQLWT